ncbi:hypothetical protein B484DRAFT_464492, partial [Ochromonadaceae sp. CCMP2298]
PSSRPSGQPSGQPSSQPSGQPTCHPTSSPTFLAEQYADRFDKRRYRTNTCENGCSGHGTCTRNSERCDCFKDQNGEDVWTGVDCSLHACPKGNAWAGELLVRNNVAHPWAECSNRGECDRDTGECLCWGIFEGMACQRNRCFNDCNGRGQCLPQRLLAERAGRNYTIPWDSMKIWGCLCDKGYRGPDCSLQECVSRADPLGGYGNEAGRDCSGRGLRTQQRLQIAPPAGHVNGSMTKDAALPVHEDEEEEDDGGALQTYDNHTRRDQSFSSSSGSGSGSGLTSSDQYGSSGVDDSFIASLDHFDDLNDVP